MNFIHLILLTQVGEENRTNVTCVFWDFELDSKNTQYSTCTLCMLISVCIPCVDGFGAWSQSGCNVSNETDSIITCQCNHLTPFGVLLVSISSSMLYNKQTRNCTIVHSM